MSSCNSHKLFIFTLFFPAFILPIVISLPVSDKPYEDFIAFLIKNNCSMPKELELPFTKTSDPSPFSYLSAPLSQCRMPEIKKEFDETHMLCTEVFDVLKNVTCGRYESFPVIESSHLSTNVCHDFANLKYNLPKKDDYLSGRLSDKVICKVLCTAEKFESLCKTLLWSYETLMKIDIALSSKEHEKENGNINKVTPAEESNVCQTNEFRCNTGDCISIELKCDHRYDCADGSDELGCVTLSEKSNPASVESEASSQITKEPDKLKTVDNLQSYKHNTPGANPDQRDQKPHTPGDLGDTLQDIASKKVSPDMKIQNEAINKTVTESISTSQNNSESKIQKLLPETLGNNVKYPESEILSNLNPQPEHMDGNKNKNIVVEELPNKEANDNNSQTNLDTINLIPDINRVNDNQKIKNVTLNMLNKNDKGDINNKVDAKSTGKSEKESVAPATTAGIDNELKNNFPEEDNKSKTKQTDLENQEVKEIEKTKQTDYESPNELLPDNDSKLPEPSTQSTLPDDEHQEDKDSDQYNDIGSEGDYVKPDYDTAFNPPSKNKQSDVKNSITDGSNQMLNGFDSNISPQNNIGRISEEIAMIAPFPEQEDSHFFFYFLTIVLVIMAGYLIFHNKQKIIALIVEGRHERRRRSHGAGYKKLETK